MAEINLREMAQGARSAGRGLGLLSTETRNSALLEIARRLERSGIDMLHVSGGMGRVAAEDDVKVPADFPHNWIVHGGVTIAGKVSVPVMSTLAANCNPVASVITPSVITRLPTVKSVSASIVVALNVASTSKATVL